MNGMKDQASTQPTRVIAISLASGHAVEVMSGSREGRAICKPPGCESFDIQAFAQERLLGSRSGRHPVTNGRLDVQILYSVGNTSLTDCLAGDNTNNSAKAHRKKIRPGLCFPKARAY